MSSADTSGVLAHHFDTMEQQHGSARLGMWAFLVTEVLFFGAIFCAYTAYRIWYPREFAAGSSKLNVLIGTINSLLLLTSSLTVTLAIYACRAGNHRRLAWCLWQLTDPERRNACAHAARKTAGQWTFEQHYRQLLGIFSEAASRKRAA